MWACCEPVVLHSQHQQIFMNTYCVHGPALSCLGSRETLLKYQLSQRLQPKEAGPALHPGFSAASPFLEPGGETSPDC